MRTTGLGAGKITFQNDGLLVAPARRAINFGPSEKNIFTAIDEPSFDRVTYTIENFWRVGRVIEFKHKTLIPSTSITTTSTTYVPIKSPELDITVTVTNATGQIVLCAVSISLLTAGGFPDVAGGRIAGTAFMLIDTPTTGAHTYTPGWLAEGISIGGTAVPAARLTEVRGGTALTPQAMREILASQLGGAGAEIPAGERIVHICAVIDVRT